MSIPNQSNNEEIWVIDECLSQKNKEKWKSKRTEIIKTVTDLNLRATKDETISSTLEKEFPQGVIIVTNNKRPDKKKNNDYFKISEKQGIIKFSSDFRTDDERIDYIKKFKQSCKNTKKVLGATITLTKEKIIWKKGKKSKTVKYTQYL